MTTHRSNQRTFQWDYLFPYLVQGLAAPSIRMCAFRNLPNEKRGKILQTFQIHTGVGNVVVIISIVKQSYILLYSDILL